MIRVIPNEYLDRRLPSWVDAEILGVIRYDGEARLVEIGPNAPEIQGHFRPVVLR